MKEEGNVVDKTKTSKNQKVEKTTKTNQVSQKGLLKDQLKKPSNVTHNDKSSDIYNSLNEKHRAVFDAIPMGEYITADGIAKLTGYKMSDILTAVTMLELKGLIDIHPGGQYGRR